MSVRYVTVEELRQFLGNPQNLAKEDILFVTDSGHPAFVFARLNAQQWDVSGQVSGSQSLANALEQPGEDANFDFVPAHISVSFKKDAV